ALNLKLDTVGEHHPSYADTLTGLGELYLQLGEFQKAIALFQQDAEITKAALGVAHPSYAAALNQLGMAYQALQHYDTAEQFIEQAIAVQRAALGEQHPDLAKYRHNLAALYRLLRRYDDEALELAQQASAGFRAALGEAHPYYAISLSNLSAFYVARREYDRAESLIHEAIARTEAQLGKQHPSLASFSSDLAVIMSATGRFAEALTAFQRVHAIHDEIIRNVFGAGSDARRLSYLATVQGHLHLALSLIRRQFTHQPEVVGMAYNWVLRRKGLAAEAVASQHDAQMTERYAHLRPQVEALRQLQRRLMQLLSEGATDGASDAHERQLAELQGERERLERDLARQIPETNLSLQFQSLDWRAIAKHLAPGTALVEFLHVADFEFMADVRNGERTWRSSRYLAFILRADRSPQLVDLGEADVINEKIDAYRAAITRSGASTRFGQPSFPAEDATKIAYRAIGLELYQCLFAPLRMVLENCLQLYLSPDGELTRLPFEVLPVAESDYLIDQYDIGYMSVGRDLLRAPGAVARSETPLVVADPDYDLGIEGMEPATRADALARSLRADHGGRIRFGALSGTRKEGQIIGQSLRVTPLMGKRALKRRIMAASAPSVLHVATHGFFLEDHPVSPDDRLNQLIDFGASNPLVRSGLALAGANTWLSGGKLSEETENGLLTAEDVTSMNLYGTQLVVLSACETGLGAIRAGEGVFGLRRAFALAGAETVVMSLWKVPDHQTQLLMSKFYQLLLGANSRQEALHQAQDELRKQYPHPYFWGAFICEGRLDADVHF
ncbi:MAG: CHAT domain-containing protein, partial [Chloroflexota bacterium]